MNFNWAEFNELAQELIGHPGLNSSLDAVCRTAISRAYYAVFCTALERLVYVDNVYIDTTRDAHQQVRDAFRTSGAAERRRVAVHLNTLRVLRNVADYEAMPSQPVDSYAAQDCTDLAAIVLDTVRNL